MRFVFVIVVIGIGLLPTLTSCKKKEVKQHEIIQPADGTISYANKFYGILTAGSYSSEINDGMVAENLNVKAYFSSVPIENISAPSAVKVNGVTFNKQAVDFNNTFKYYFRSYDISLDTALWSINGSNGMPSFSLEHKLPTPTCNNLQFLPDSIQKSVGCEIIITGVTNVSNAWISIQDAGASAISSYSVPLSKGNNTISIPSEKIIALTSTNSGSISITMQNASAYYFGGMDFQFVKEARYTKKIKIKA